ncbi:MAG: PAS domain S-box protein, partial [Betaproteobacteria bacterium]|nr:PAS domain S-box protein [Betaproteobacteria bacterium]
MAYQSHAEAAAHPEGSAVGDGTTRAGARGAAWDADNKRDESGMERKAKARRASRARWGTGRSGRGKAAKAAVSRPVVEARLSAVDSGTMSPRLKVSPAFRQVFENVPVGIAHFALDGRYLHVNTALCGLLGYSERELLARRVQDI